MRDDIGIGILVNIVESVYALKGGAWVSSDSSTEKREHSGTPEFYLSVCENLSRKTITE